jgi:hypothetical protein
MGATNETGTAYQSGPFVVITIWSSFITYYQVNLSSAMGATNGTGTAYQSGAHEFSPIFRGVRVAQFLVFCVVYCKSLFVFFF